MKLVERIRTQKLLEKTATERGKRCKEEDRARVLDNLVSMGKAMGLEPWDAEQTAREAFIMGCKIGGWNTWGL